MAGSGLDSGLLAASGLDSVLVAGSVLVLGLLAVFWAGFEAVGGILGWILGSWRHAGVAEWCCFWPTSRARR